ncbi:hypothetical protein G6F23_014376 [Rhizopus arrhizus]|nr:hypothetical protein G6F23_014376 [Rhizopus arrhizus]
MRRPGSRRALGLDRIPAVQSAEGLYLAGGNGRRLGARAGVRHLAQLQQRDQRALAFQAVPEAVRLHLARGSAAGRVQLARQGGRHDQDHRLQGRHAETDARTG